MDTAPLRIIITGASGFIGAMMTRYFYREGMQVLALLRPESDRWRLADLPLEPGTTDYSPGQLRSLLEKFQPDAIIHAAAPNGHCRDLQHYQQALGESQYLLGNLLQEAAALAKAPVFVHLCSSMLYAHQQEALREEGPMAPINYRGLIKLQERNLCRYYAEQQGLKVRVLRVFRAYGPYDHPDRLIAVLCRGLDEQKPVRLSPDHIKRDYILVDDLSRMALQLIKLQSNAPFIEVNGGSGREYAAREIMQQLAAIAERDILLDEQPFAASPADRSVSRADTQKLETLLAWQGATSIEIGLRQCWDWYKQNKALWKS